MSSLYLGINVIIHFWKLYPVQIKVGFDFSYGMLSRSIDLNQASFYYSGLSRYFYIRRTFRQRYLTPAAAAAIICTYDFKVTFLVGYIGILFECNIHIEVLLFVSIPSHVLLKLKFFIWTFTKLHIRVKHKHVSYVNLTFQKSVFEGDFSFYVCAGI
jgi:hypothetical protein